MAEETTATNTATETTTQATASNSSTNAATAAANTEAKEKAEQTVLSAEDIQKLIQKTVDQRTADYGKKIATLQEENKTLKKANMTAEEIQKAEREEFEKQKAEVELGKRQLHAHRVVAGAGYGDNADEVVEMVLGDSDERTDERLKNFKALVDKLVADTVKKTFETNGRTPNSGNSNGGNEKKENGFAAELGKKQAETLKQSNDILKHYYGG